MAISYPLDLPSFPGFVSIQLSKLNNGGLAENPSTFQSQYQEHSGKKWGIMVSLPPLTRVQAAPWRAFLTALNGQKGSFLAGDPLATEPLGAAAGMPLVDGASQTGLTLNTRGWSVEVPGILLKGDYIQIGQRLYEICEDADSDDGGEATLEIWPNIRQPAPPDGEAILTTNAKGLFRLNSSVTDIFSADLSKIYDMSFAGIEYL